MAKDIERHRLAEANLWSNYGVEPLERWVTLASGGKVRVQEVGTGPPVVFIHGGAISGTSWCKLVAGLEGLRCILIDRPGCGLSDPIVGGPLTDLASLKDYADHLLADLLDALELDQASVAGTSYGGFFAFRGAAAIPGRVTSLIEYSWLIGAPSESAPLAARVGSIPGLQGFMSRLPMSRSMVKGALRQFGLGKAIDSGAFDDAALDWAHALLRHTDTMANDVGSMPKLFTPIRGQNDEVLLSDDLLSKLTMPTLFLWGEKDPNGGVTIARTFAPRLPNAELVVVDGAEHAPWLDDPATCVTRTQEFLTREL